MYVGKTMYMSHVDEVLWYYVKWLRLWRKLLDNFTDVIGTVLLVTGNLELSTYIFVNISIHEYVLSYIHTYISKDVNIYFYKYMWKYINTNIINFRSGRN